MRALVVDDSPVMRSLLRRLLRELSIETVEADNGHVALERLAECGDIDFALVEWSMPVMTGLEFIQVLRAHAAYDDLRVMMITAETETSQAPRAIEAGADAHMGKPFTKEELHSKLGLLLRS